MLRAARAILGSRWPLLGLAGVAVSVVVAGWALIADGDVALAAVSLLLGLTLIGLVVAVSALTSTEQRVRSLEVRLKKAASTAQDTTDALQAIQTAQSDPTGGPLGAIVGAQRVDATLRHDELLAQSEQSRAQLQAELDQVRADIAALASSLGAVTDGIGSVRDGLGTVTKDISGVKGRLDNGFKRIGTASETQLSELSALANLYTMFRPGEEVPVLGGFAAAPQTILRLTSLVRELPDDALIVECGSGSSTVWLALACRRAGKGRVVALEHHELYAERTREALARHGLDDVAEVRVAPLEPVTVGGEKHDWYAAPRWTDLRGIDLLFVDGPPGNVGPRSRFPAFPLLASALDDAAIVALDDAQRQDEADIAADWLAEAVDGVRLTDDHLIGRTRFFTVTR